MAKPRLKFRFEAYVEYVTEELSHNGIIFFMFNIKVRAALDTVDGKPEIIQWSVIKSDDEFMQTLKVLKTKYGLLKSFYFRNPSSIGNNMFHLTHPVKPRREKKDEFLALLMQLDPIPIEASDFLCLENATYANKATNEQLFSSSNGVSSPGNGNPSTPSTTLSSPLPEATVSPVSTATTQPSSITGVKKWYPDGGLIGLVATFLALTLGAALLSYLSKKVRTYPGVAWITELNITDSTVILVFRGFGQFIHSNLLMLKARLEVVVILALIYIFAHRVIGFALGWYLRSLLDPEKTGKFAFHFEWISFRCGLDQNMIVLSGIEWRNPACFQHTPFLLRIDELSFTIDAATIMKAVSRTSAIKIKEIRFNKVVFHIEKYTPKILDRKESKISIEATNSDMTAERIGSLRQQTLATTNTNTVSVSSTSPVFTTSTLTTTVSSSTTLKPGVLNLWAAMGAIDDTQEKSMLLNVTTQMSNAVEGGSSMVGVLSKYNPAALLYKGGTHLGSTGVNIVGSIGNTIGLGYFTKKRVKENDNEELDDIHTDEMPSADELNAQAADQALQQTLQAIEEDQVDSGDDSGADDATVDSFTDIKHNKTALRSAHSTNNMFTASMTHTKTKTSNSAGATVETSTTRQLSPTKTAITTSTTTLSPQPERTEKKDKTSEDNKDEKPTSKENKKGFGMPYLLDIENLQLDRVELHTQDFLNSTHSDVKYGVIKLKSLSMNRKDLTKPPKDDPTISEAENLHYRNKRRPLFLDDVVWRLVNKLLAELIKNNSIAMMVLLSAAAANNATSVVSSASSLAYSGAATGGRFLNRAGSAIIGPSKSFKENLSAAPVKINSPGKPL